MTLLNAQREFRIRHYIWAISEFDKEIGESFPNLRLFKAGYAWEVFQFMQQLNKNDQLALAHALLKKWHSDAATSLAETFSTEENSLLGRLRVFASAASIEVDHAIMLRRRGGEKIRFASKHTLRNVMIEQFKSAFGGRCVRMDNGEGDPLFGIRCAGWVVSTQLWFGRNESLIQYRHDIESEIRVQHPRTPGITGPAMLLDQCISWLYFNQMKHIGVGDVDSASNAIRKFCGYFLDVAPKMLRGLEFDKIDVNQ